MQNVPVFTIEDYKIGFFLPTPTDRRPQFEACEASWGLNSFGVTCFSSNCLKISVFSQIKYTASFSETWLKHLLAKHYLFDPLNSYTYWKYASFYLSLLFHPIQEGWFWLWNVTVQPRMRCSLHSRFSPVLSGYCFRFVFLSVYLSGTLFVSLCV